MKKANFIYFLLLLGALFSFSSCKEELKKADFDFTQDPSKISSVVSLDVLEKASEEEIHFKATIKPSDDIVYDQGVIYSTTDKFERYEVISIVPDTTANGIFMEMKAYPITQGVTYYFKAFVLTKEGIALSSEVKSINLPITWVTLGKVNLTDNTFSGDTYPVNIQKFEGQNRYRLVDPFATGTSQYLVFFLDNDANALQRDFPAGAQDCGAEGYVFYWHPNYVGSYCTFSNKANVYTITFLLLKGSSLYTGGEIIFEWIDGYPGEIPAPEPDYSVGIEYGGRFIDPNDNYFAMANVTSIGADVASVKVALVPGAMTQEALDGIIDGSIESKDVKTPGHSKYPVAESGIYTFVAVSYANDEAQDFDYATFNFVIGSAPEFTINDFMGNFHLTGPSQFAGKPDADMNVSIEAGAEKNTLIITGITYCEEVKATFDPEAKIMSIAPQPLADYGEYDITLYTTTPDGKASETAAMDFVINSNGNLVMSPASEADGYLLYSDAAGGWVSGYYDLVFTKQILKASNANPLEAISVHKDLKRANAASNSNGKNLSKGNFSIRHKVSSKNLLLNLNAIPAF